MNARKLFSVLLVLCLMLQCIPLAAAAEPQADLTEEPITITYPVAIDETNFPDENFRNYVASHFDKDKDGRLSKAEAEAVTDINLNSSGIGDLTGIIYFQKLYWLRCNDNQLTSIDVSNNKELYLLHCKNNKLTAIDVSSNTDLQILVCDNNQIDALNVTKNTALVSLCVADNQLSTLDVSKNARLVALYVSGNKLTNLDVSNNTRLNDLSCEKKSAN